MLRCFQRLCARRAGDPFAPWWLAPTVGESARLLLWTPLLAAGVGLLILGVLRLLTPLYLATQGVIIAYTLLALFGPAHWQRALLTLAPLTYAAVLLVTWAVALYVLPDHPATDMVRLAVLLYLTTVYVFMFIQGPPRTATWQASVVLAALVITALPHAARTLGQTGAFDGVMVLLTALLSHGALIAVLRAFGTVRDQLAHAEGHAQTLHELAHRDPLTGLLNRRALDRELARVAAGAQPGWWLAVIDVDGLKGINDALGHAAGDDLLSRFAVGFTRASPANGQVFRIGGDEFAVLFQEGPITAQALVAAAALEVQDTYPEAGASVGAARWQMGESADVWLSRADQAMYQHKRRMALAANKLHEVGPA
ncbi:GGDEF domain-containing protein [Deinococcus marmoris]|uniref:GGDEF domain-containing protein n=1 Tax=Deinococcus marmoris TaxID=249408 RepID=UPI0009FA18EA|nr:GGDEF domain-containing protein [Deinococcus marmoris]